MDQIWITLEDLAERWRLDNVTPKARKDAARRAVKKLGLREFKPDAKKTLLRLADVEAVEAAQVREPTAEEVARAHLERSG